MNIADIKIGTRHRKLLGDIKGLADSIQVRGLMHPVVIDKDNNLIAGERRIAAAKLLGWTEIPITIATKIDDAISALQAERDENECRENFTPSEAVALGNAIEKIESPKAEETRLANLKIGDSALISRSGNLPPRECGKTRDKVAAAVGMSGRTYEKAKAVVKEAESDPVQFGPVKEEMDRTGNVNGAHRKMQQIKGVSRPAKAVIEIKRSVIEKLSEQLQAIQKHLDRRSLQLSPIELRRLVSEFADTFSQLEKAITESSYVTGN